MRGCPLVKLLIFASAWLVALSPGGQAQESAVRYQELSERIDAARAAGRLAGRAQALEAVKRGEFSYPGVPHGPWAREFLEELSQNGIRWGGEEGYCGNELVHLAQKNSPAFAEFVARTEAFDEIMSEELIRRFGADFIQRAEAAAKQAYEKKLIPAATPQPKRKKKASR
jgi:hypothetical protein